MAKAIGIFFAVIIGIMLIPVFIGLIGGAFGLVVGLLGGLIGAVAGIIGGLFGAIFGVIGWFFETLFGWEGDYWHFGVLNLNFFTVTILVIVVALLMRTKNQPNRR